MIKAMATDRNIRTKASAKNYMQLRVEPNTPPPSLEICVELDRHNSKILYFSLHSRVAGYTFANFGQISLQTPLEEKVRTIYERFKELAKIKTTKKALQQDFDEKRLASLGYELWDELIPEKLQQEYWKFQIKVSSVLITSDEPWIPWELVKPYRYHENGDREEALFWCQQFDISRWLSGPAPADEIFTGIARAVIPLKSNLASITDEATFINELNVLNKGMISLEPIVSRTDLVDWVCKKQFSILHFACHGMFDDFSPNESAIQLSDGLLIPSDIGIRFTGPLLRPLVFINACHSGRIGFNFTKLGGWATRFLEARVGLFIGAMWEVNDELALKFAHSFYSKFLRDEKTAAVAFREAREEIRKLAPYNPTWLAYVLYADPNSRIRDLQIHNAVSLQEVLLKLKFSIEAEPKLDDEDRIEALEQIQILSESDKEESNTCHRKKYKTAIKILKGTVTSLPSNSSLSEVCHVLIPDIIYLMNL